MRILAANEVAQLLDVGDCVREVENAFRARGEGRRSSSAVVGLALEGGGLHAKLGALDLRCGYAVAKINANFPENPSQRGLPTIQGVLVLFDASSGTPLACIDSPILTAMRTAAASAVAARYLAVQNASSVACIGCGIQARAHLKALRHVRPINHITLFDLNTGKAEALAASLRDSEVLVTVADDLKQAARSSEIVVTSTASRTALLDVGDLAPGTFVAAVGADDEHKQEITPQLLRSAAVVVDDLDQCARIGDLHHAIDQGVMRLEDVRASLDQVVTRHSSGRQGDDEIIIFDSTGVAIEDVAAAALVYERAESTNTGFVIG